MSAADLLLPAVVTTRAKLIRLGPTGLERLERFPEHLHMSEETEVKYPWPNWDIWYSSTVLRSLEDIRDQILLFRRNHCFPHLLTSLFQTAWDVSAADKRVIVPTRSKYSRRAPRLSADQVRHQFLQRTERILRAQRALTELGISLGRPKVWTGDSLTPTAWPSSRLDVILTSPPYGCGIDYVRASMLQMNLCDLHSPYLDVRRKMIGRSRYLYDDGHGLPEFSPREEKLLKEIAALAPSRSEMFNQYLVDVRTFLVQAHAHLLDDGILGIIMGDPQIAMKRVPLSSLVTRIAENEGFELIEKPATDRIRNRIQNFNPRSATEPIQREVLLTFSPR
ncbi:MAG: hypothetical protein KAW09_08110 [Thermoplasmata archaeon]|nr:hypothetical protein [Thermoplasmata archaeon]